MTLGDIIKDYRQAHNMSMADFALRSGISKAYISLLEKNKHPRNGKPIAPSIKCIKQAADGMNMDFNILFSMIDSDVTLNSQGLSAFNSYDENTNVSIAENIRFLRKNKNWTQDYVAEQLGYKSFTTIQKWESGVAEPPIKKLQELATLFGVDMNSLANTDLTSPTSAFSNFSIKAVRIPVLGYVRAGIPLDAVEEILDYEEITPEMAASGDYFCLQVKGDSMEPKFSEGDVVVVKQQSDVESGDIAIVLVDGQDATIKKLVKYNDSHSIALVASNPLYPPMIFTEKEIAETPVTVIGKVVELRAKF